MLPKEHLRNLQEFIKDNAGIITTIGVFGALMSYLVINIDSLISNSPIFGDLLPFLSVIIFLFFSYSLIKIIGELPKDKKGDYIVFFEYCFGAFSIILTLIAINLFINTILGVYIIILVILSLIYGIKIYEKCEKWIKKNNFLTLVVGIILYFIFNKIYEDIMSSGINEKSSIAGVIGIWLVFIIILLIMFPSINLLKKIFSWTKDIFINNKWFLIIVLILMALIIFLYFKNDGIQKVINHLVRLIDLKFS
ncbi:MAG: hypothetical protein KKA61_01875 [Nanoarchaeota archaeon]|nr:hypothetical protein [Nanoarchaeota archaeon]MBU4493091.1 hypothetical protein [Nanoarchaeota archaeon]